MVRKDAALQQTYNRNYCEYLATQHSYFSIEAVTRYHNPCILFIAFVISAALLLTLIGLVRWPKINPPEHISLKIQLTQPTSLTQKPELPLSPDKSPQDQLSQQSSQPQLYQPQSTPKDSKLKKPPAESQAKPVQPDKTKLKENKPPQTEQAPATLPLKAKIFDTLHYQESHQALDQAPRQNLFNSQNQNPNSSSAKSSPKFVGGYKGQIQTYQAQNGDTMVAIDGRCYRVFDDEFSPTGKSWSLPTRCTGHKTESDRIAEGLRKSMQERFDQR